MTETGETVVVLSEGKKEVEHKTTPPNILIFTDKETRGLTFAKTIEGMKIAAPGVREGKPDHPTSSHFTQPEIVYLARNGAYWSGYVGFVFNESDMFSSHQYFDGGSTGIRLFDPEFDGVQNLKPATIDLNKHPFLIILDGDVYSDRLTTIHSELVKSHGLSPEKAEEWIDEHVIPIYEILSEARRFCLEYFKTEEGRKNLTDIRKEFGEAASLPETDQKTRERLLLLVKDKNLLVREKIVGNGYFSSGGGVMSFFQTPKSTDLYGESMTTSLRPTYSLLQHHMVDWLRERHFNTYKDQLPEGQFKAVESGNLYHDIPLRTLRPVEHNLDKNDTDRA